jgi:intracellular sulfur oxidation DsrE/DsrF family protein
MISRARHGMAVLMAVGCLVGLSPLAACAQEEYKPPVAKEKSTTQKSPSQKSTKVAQASAKEKAKEKEKAKKAAATEKVHKISIQVAENNPQLMNLALNNASNIISHYKKLGEKAVVEIVTFGPGLTMLRDDTSPVKARIQTMSLENPELTFAACANTQTNMSKQESKDIPIMSEAKITPSGVVRLAELQSQGYAYIRP